MSKHSQTFIKDLDEGSIILKLLREIEKVTKFSLTPVTQGKHMVIQYLKDYRMRRPITKESLDAIPFSNEFLLMQKIKKLHDTDIYWLCNEIARMKMSGVEKNSGMTLYVFLDRYLKDDKKKKLPKSLTYKI